MKQYTLAVIFKNHHYPSALSLNGASYRALPYTNLQAKSILFSSTKLNWSSNIYFEAYRPFRSLTLHCKLYRTKTLT